jgi:hypothetical protein
MSVSQETTENLERFETSRFSKICQVKPLDFEITEDRNKIQKAILTLDNAIPVEAEEEDN